MRQLTVIILFATSLTTLGQVRSVGKVYIDNRNHFSFSQPYFEFNEHDTTLTQTSQQHLNDFGRLYKDSVHSKHILYIELAPSLTDEEQEREEDLGLKRMMAIVNYLTGNYKIDKSRFKACFKETITNDGCVGFLNK
jgi:hypothetical protein